MRENLQETKVSVITPLYNSSTFIGETLDRLCAQTYTNWESLLIDDGSTDETAKTVAPYLADRRFRYIRQENQGIAGARNTGIRAAVGEWICLMDHDDHWMPTKLEKEVRYATDHRCDIVCTNAFIVTDRDRWLYGDGFPDAAAAAEQALNDPDVDVFAHLIKVNFALTSSVMIRRSLFDKHGLLDPSVVPVDDYDMWLRCMPEARFGFLREPLVEYLMHERNYSRNMVRMFDRIIRVLQRHRRRHAKDKRRRIQFDEALTRYFVMFFRQAAQDRSRAYAIWHTLWLLKGAPQCASRLMTFRQLMSFSAGAPRSSFAARVKASATYRWGQLRAGKASR
jgi:glycosyltransferase involved in cell wall biosynthesis